MSTVRSGAKRARPSQPFAANPLLLEQLNARLASYESDSDAGFVFATASIVTASDALRVRNALDRFGVAILTDAVSVASVDAAKRDLGRAVADMWRDELPPAVLAALTERGDLAALDACRNAKHHFGNCNASFFYKQPPPADAYPRASIDDETIQMDWNTVYANVNIPLLEREPHTAAVLLAVSQPGALVSVDSAKATSGCVPPPKGLVKPALTRAHFDRYAPATQRLQGMIVADGRVKLGFVPGTCDSTVQTLLAQCVGDAALFQRTGFVGLAHDRALKRALDAHWRAPPARSLVLWKQGVLHYEALSEPPSSPSLCWRFSADDLALGEPRLRFVVGTHVVDNAVLPLRAVQRLAAHAVSGMAPATYFSPNRGTRVQSCYVVNLRSTSFLRRRVILGQEAARMRLAIERCNSARDDDIRQCLNGLSPLRRRLMCGGSYDADYAPLSECGFTPSDEAMIRVANRC